MKTKKENKMEKCNDCNKIVKDAPFGQCDDCFEKVMSENGSVFYEDLRRSVNEEKEREEKI
jgi:hypothetical protein